MSSELVLDELTGRSSAGSIAVTAEGGTNTTNLQQGLCKSWWFVTGTGTAAITDSLNTSGIVDNGGSGDYTVSFSTNMGNATYSIGGMCGIASSTDATSRNVQPFGGAILAGSLRYNTTSNDANVDQDLDTINYIQIFGDLA
tara:strand:- start:487 stop:912 length:426 start_codon:yes stop_codon:yes gene_type:complete